MSEDFRPSSFIEIAMQRARSIAAARQDLPHYIFPASSFPVDEHLLAGVKNSLYMLVFNIERSLLRQSLMTNRILDRSNAYPVLQKSGLLNDPIILDHALSLFRFQSLIMKKDTEKSPSYYVADIMLQNHSDHRVRSCVEILSLGHSRFHSLGLGNFFELSPEDLHRLAWRIVATFEITDGQIEQQMMEGATKWLSVYDEAETISASAGKLIYLLRSDDQFELDYYWKFTSNNAALFIALLENESGLQRQIILNILTDRSPILCGLLFRAIDMDRELALANISTIFDHKNKANGNITIQIANEYDDITPNFAMNKLQEWTEIFAAKLQADSHD